MVQERHPHHSAQRDLHRHFNLGRQCQGQGRAGAGGEGLPRHRVQDPVPQGQPADALPRPEEGPPPPGGKLLPAERAGQVPQVWAGVVRPGLQERPVLLLRLPVVDEAGQRGLRRPPAERPPLRGDGRGEDSHQHPHRGQHPGAGQAGGRGDGRGSQGPEDEAGDRGGGTGRRAAALGAALQPGGDHGHGHQRFQAPHQGPPGAARAVGSHR